MAEAQMMKTLILIDVRTQRVTTVMVAMYCT